MIIFLFRWFRR